jgi:hypothetical protein
MTIQFQQVSSLAEFNFDVLFDASFPGFDKNFPWHLTFGGITPTHQQKKDFYLTQLTLGISDNLPLKKENEQLLMFKVTLDGKEVMFKGGYIENDGITHRGHWFLTDTDLDGSRKWMYTEEFDTAQRDFYAQSGITHYKALTYVGSDLHRILRSRTYYIQNRSLANRAEIINEEIDNEIPDIPGFPKFVVMTIKL